MWVGAAVRQVWQFANGQQGSASDITSIVQCFEEWVGVEVKARTGTGGNL
jgi:hypothetical protein